MPRSMIAEGSTIPEGSAAGVSTRQAIEASNLELFRRHTGDASGRRDSLAEIHRVEPPNPSNLFLQAGMVVLMRLLRLQKARQ